MVTSIDFTRQNDAFAMLRRQQQLLSPRTEQHRNQPRPAAFADLSNPADCDWCQEVVEEKDYYLTLVPQPGQTPIPVRRVEYVCEPPPPITEIDCEEITLNDYAGRPYTIKAMPGESLSADVGSTVQGLLGSLFGNTPGDASATVTRQQCANSCQEQLNKYAADLKAQYDKAVSDEEGTHPAVWLGLGAASAYLLTKIL